MPLTDAGSRHRSRTRPTGSAADGSARNGSSREPHLLSPLLSPRQAAVILRISPRSLQNWRYRGGGPPYVKVGSAVRYRREDLEAFVVQSVRRNTSDVPQNR